MARAARGQGSRTLVNQNGKTELDIEDWEEVSNDRIERIRKLLTQIRHVRLPLPVRSCENDTL